MRCIYCNIEFDLQSPDKCQNICMSKKCIAQFAFDHLNKPINVYKPGVQKFLLELAVTASKYPARFDPIPIGYSDACLDEKSHAYTKFLNYLELSLGNVDMIDDPIVTFKFVSYTFDYSNEPWEGFTYLFHGSPYHNWHSIMRNGLKNYSGTDKMTSGQAYGPGIYFSDDLSFSFAYAGGNYDKYAIGVFEVRPPSSDQKLSESNRYNGPINDFTDSIREIYQKTTNIFVVPFEENVRLKYLVVIPNMDNLKSFSSLLIKYFCSRLRDVRTNVPKFNALSIKRLMKERKSIETLIPNMEIKDMSSQCWRCTYKNHVFEITFPDRYPIKAPNIRMISPKINHPNLYDSYVCMDVLYNWQLNNKLEHVVLTFIIEFLERSLIPSDPTIQLPLIQSNDPIKTYLLNKMVSITIDNSINNTNEKSNNKWSDVRNALELTRYL